MSDEAEKKPSFDLNDFIKGKKIGYGSFGMVFIIEEKNTNKIYAAKVAKKDFKDLEHEEQVNLIREININSKLDHPAVIRFVGLSPVDFDGYNNIVIATEFIKNGSLGKYIQNEAKSENIDGWDFTKKLIIIYGIAVGMSYLHSHDILHRDLKPDNILIDDFLYPKIADFGLSKSCDSNTISQSCYKGSPAYSAPEVLESSAYSKAGDVYSFAITIYQMLTLNVPFNGENTWKVMREVILGTRPPLTENVPDVYKELIESCWRQEPSDRPTFDQIVHKLKSEPGFITSEVNKEEFMKYVNYIDNYNVTFDADKYEFKLEDFIQGKTESFRKQTIAFNHPILPEEDIVVDEIKCDNNDDTDNDSDNDDIPTNDGEIHSTPAQKKATFNSQSNNNIDLSIFVNNQSLRTPQKRSKSGQRVKSSPAHKKSNRISFPIDDLRKLNEKGKNLISIAEYNPDFQFLVGKNLIEGLEDFPKNPQLGIKYIKNSMECECCDAVLYYCQLLVDGQVIPKDIKKAKKELKKNFKLNDSRLYFLYGKILAKENKLSEAKKYFKEAAKEGNAEAQHEYAKIVLNGKGVKHNTKKAEKYFEMSKKNGINRSDLFIDILNVLECIPNYNNLPDEVQQFFISQITNYYENSNNNHSVTPNNVPIYIPFDITKIMFKSKSIGFEEILSYFENISIEIKFPSKKYDNIYSTVSHFKKAKKKNLNVTLFICNSNEIDHKFGFNNIIDRVFVDKSVHVLKSNVFSNCVKLSELMISNALSYFDDYVFSGCSSLVHFTIPTSIKTISKRAFSLCKSLNSIVIPSSVTIIKECAFYGCSSLTKIDIPSSVVYIGSGCFDECSSLEKIVIPSSLTKINSLTFSGCSSIKEISIPTSVTLIDDYSFFGCSSLENIEIPSSVSLIGERAFFNCSSLKKITVPSSVSSIRYMAFGGCNSLTSVSLPSSLSSKTNLGIDPNQIK